MLFCSLGSSIGFVNLRNMNLADHLKVLLFSNKLNLFEMISQILLFRYSSYNID